MIMVLKLIASLCSILDSNILYKQACATVNFSHKIYSKDAIRLDKFEGKSIEV